MLLNFIGGRKEAWLQEKNIFRKGSDIIMIPKWRYHDIDTLDDWKYAELSHRHMLKKNYGKK